jgi:hypothetical protein
LRNEATEREAGEVRPGQPEVVPDAAHVIGKVA